MASNGRNAKSHAPEKIGKILADVLVDVLDLSKEPRERVVTEYLERLEKEFGGGHNLYIPVGSARARAARDVDIYLSLNAGVRWPVLAEKYDLARSSIYGIAAKQAGKFNRGDKADVED